MHKSESRDVCSFCKKEASDTRILVPGPGVNICDECIETCVDIVQERRSSGTRGTMGKGTDDRTSPARAATVVCTLCREPTPTSDALLMENEGVLCRTCVTQINASFPKTR